MAKLIILDKELNIREHKAEYKTGDVIIDLEKIYNQAKQERRVIE